MRRGVGLGTTLVVACLVLTLGFAVASLSVSHLGLQTRAANSDQALDLARSTVQLALGRVLQDRNYRAPVDYANDSGSGHLTFEAAGGLPVSTNNLSGAGSVSGADGQVVPAQSLHLVAIGECRGVRRRVEALYTLPPFPYAAASDGAIEAAGGVEALGVGDPPGPASLLSNAGTDRALVLGPGSRVSGGLKSVGGIVVDPTSVVSGRVQPRQAREELGRLFLQDYDPSALGRPCVALEAHYGQADFTGLLRRQGDLRVDGDLKLHSALIFVQGDLTVAGSLSGTGILAVTGNVTVQQNASLVADDKLALVSGGKLSLLGTGPAGSSLQGVVYAEGGVEARQITVRGVVVAHDPGVSLDRCRLIRDPDYSSVSLTLTGPPLQTDRFFVPFGRVGSQPPTDVIPSHGYYRVEVRREATDLFRAYVYLREGQSGGLVRPGTLDEVVDQLVGFTHVERDAARTRLQKLGTGATGSPDEIRLTVDPSRFLPDSERIRVLLWRELSAAR